MDDKTTIIIDSLISLTSAGKLEWQYTNTENSYKIELDSATLVISYSDYNPMSGQSSEYSLTMYNGTGKPIELVSIGTINNIQDGYSKMMTLYGLARESTNKRNSTLDKIISELSLKDIPF